MFCFGCGNEIPEGEKCPVCAAGRAARRHAPGPEELGTWFCRDCGNEVPEGRDCPVCADRERAPRPEPAPRREREATVLCRGCGNEIPEGEECPVCAAARARREARASQAAEARTTFCRSCGNEVPAGRPCPVCEESRTRMKELPAAVLCPRCGNMVEDPRQCPICAAGRGTGKHTAPSVPACPRCEDPLESQDWDGVAVLLCPTCQGVLFPLGGLEKTFDKLREASEEAKLPEVLREFKDRYQRKLAAAVRYKHCPVCTALMTRRNYMGVSGVIVDVCGKHGTWVDQAAFGDLAAFISRGGDVLAARNPLRRRR